MMTRNVRIAALFTTALAACTQVTHPSDAAEAYCRQDGENFSLFAVNPQDNLDLAFAVSTWKSGLNFAVFGTASRMDSSHWRFEDNMNSTDPDERCAVDIARGADGSYTLAFDRAARCASMGGHRQTPETLSFTGSERRPINPAALKPDVFMSIGHCQAPR